ncbi:MAG: acyl carrier protein [Acidobacteria bacterium]|nr:MAG: acyl carrier protein [Acidobacteriota bacterium]REJ99324.1 MAG: acyl carrier protein [Acidobacteriota bacterium]REK15654.1 MAG: acyl carrier protein [Acidobacteriota bacterium]REK43637.1 MAG: acyl carrier protein [Acidobacteriota bacterium]
MNPEIADKTISVIAEFKEMEKDKISVDTKLDSLEMDSLDALNLVFELEEAFDITIPDEQAFETKTVGEMVEGIETLLEMKDKETESGSEEE